MRSPERRVRRAHGTKLSGADEGIPCVVGYALTMRALHGGNAKHDRIASHQIAALLRGGLMPQADGYPRRMRATREGMLRRDRRDRPFPARPGVRLRPPPGQACQGAQRQAARSQRPEERHRASHLGMLRSGGTLAHAQ
jgi:hypothetical protein